MSPDTEERGPTARALLQLLYPPPHRLDPGAAPERVRFLAVPHVRAPRLVADARSPRLAARAIRHQSRPPRLRLRAARTTLAAAARTGWYDRLPGAGIVVYGPADAASIEDPLRETLGGDAVRVAMAIGPRRANRKPVLQVGDVRGNVLAYVKVGHNELTRSLVRSEAAALATLASRSWEVVRLPRVLRVLDWNDLTLLVLEPLRLPRRRPRAALARQRLHHVVSEIASAVDEVRIPWATHPLRVRLRERLGRSRSPGPWLRELDRLPTDVVLRTGAWHGDLNPGNVALSRHRCPVWDWERFESDVPVGFDLLHHDLQESITHRLVPPATAVADLLRSAPAALTAWGHDRDQADAVCRAYLISLAGRYLADDQVAAGATLGRVDEWLLPALGTWRS